MHRFITIVSPVPLLRGSVPVGAGEGDACVALAGGATRAQEQDEGGPRAPTLRPNRSRPYNYAFPSNNLLM
ncbi:MAG: hypothetical protein E6J36_08655 [Chloroflexi bacterium]|nr:MAG: hypothetical protein E6J36_08655 [Chloroflexota bacterium]